MIEQVILALTGVLIAGFCVIFALMFAPQRNSKTKKDYSLAPKVSIVIPTMNEEAIIEKRLTNILEMNYPPDKMEVIFVDNSKDRTPEIIKTYAAKYPFLTLQKQGKKGFNNALNQGYASATGDIIIKSDSTAMPHPDALREIVANFSDESVGAVCGVHVFNNGDDIEKEFKGVMYRVQLMESYFHSSLISHGSFGAYRKFLTPTLGEEITADDSEVVVNVVRNGYRAIIDPEVKSEEESPKSFKERRSQKNRRAAGVIRVLVRNLDMLFNEKYGNFGMVTLPVDLFLLVISPILLFTICTLWLIYLATNLSTSLIIATLVVGSFAAFSIGISAKVRAVADTYLSCFIGIFQSFQKKKNWR